MYLVGVKRRFWFGYKKFLAKRAFLRGFQTLYASDGLSFEGPVQPHLVIELPDGTEHYITDIENRDWFSRALPAKGK